jgi:hypothetical protein
MELSIYTFAKSDSAVAAVCTFAAAESAAAAVAAVAAGTRDEANAA